MINKPENRQPLLLLFSSPDMRRDFWTESQIATINHEH